MQKKPNRIRKWLVIALLIPLAPLWLVLALGYVVYFILSVVVLHIAVWLFWCTRGRRVMFVFSDSPVSKPFIQTNILPRLPREAIVLNWSERKTWSNTFAKRVFYHFGGSKNYCPLGIVFRPFKRTLVFRFWKPFIEFKKGNQEGVMHLTEEFFTSVGHSQ